MTDGITLDQLRTFLAAVHEGSFSAAGRSLGRAQSAVSHTLAGLESQLGVQLFDRSARLPKLTEQGRALVDQAREVLGSVHTLKARALELAGGREAELSVAIDAIFPVEVLTRAIAAFTGQFPDTPLRLHCEALGTVLQRVSDGRCRFAVSGTALAVPPTFVHEQLRNVEMVFVASPAHALARYKGPAPARVLSEYVQLVLAGGSRFAERSDFGAGQRNVWNLADLGMTVALLRSGLGWGAVPLAAVHSEIESGTLVKVDVQESCGPGPYQLPIREIHLPQAPPGPAGRWLIQRLKEGSHHLAAIAPSGSLGTDRGEPKKDR
jgi:DNA-binding transcriptional LysR family regulator